MYLNMDLKYPEEPRGTEELTVMDKGKEVDEVLVKSMEVKEVLEVLEKEV